MNEWKFNPYVRGQDVMTAIGKVRIVFVNSRHEPTLYDCETLDGKHQCSFYEEEIETVFQHDKRVGLLNK